MDVQTENKQIVRGRGGNCSAGLVSNEMERVLPIDGGWILLFWKEVNKSLVTLLRAWL